MMKYIKKFLGVFLSMIFVLNLAGASNVNAAEVKTTKKSHYVVNSKEIDMTREIKDGKIYVTITSSILSYPLSYVADGDIVTMNYGDYSATTNRLDYVDNGSFDNTLETNSLLNTISLASSAIRYGSKLYSKYDTRYYYCSGYSGVCDYLMIGCNANYEIRTDNLSDARRNNVNKYINGIDNSNRHYNNAIAYTGAEIVSGIFAIIGAGGLLLAIAPEVVFIGLIGLGLTGTLTSVTAALFQLSDGQADFNQAANIYDTIKGYGVQI